MKVVKIDFNKCTGCQTCEVICSLSHTGNIINPEKSRIRVFRDEEHGLFFPVMAGPYTETECVNKSILVIGENEYYRCDICNAACPSRTLFKDPITNMPLRCDMCGKCVEWCPTHALTLEKE